MRKTIFAALMLLPLAAQAQDFIRYYSPGGTPFTGGTMTTPVLGIAADSCSAITFSFVNDTNSGLCSSAADTLNLHTAGSSRLSVNSTAVTSTVPITVQNGAKATGFQVFNTADETTNYEVAGVKWTSDQARFFSAKGGSGTARPVRVESADGRSFQIGGTCSVHNWCVDTNGMFVPQGDGVNDIGTSTTSVRQLNLKTSLQGSRSKSFADATATAFVRLTVGDDDYEGCTIGWTAYAEDADTDARQVRKGHTNVAILNNSGTEACNFSASADDEAILVTAGTLTCTFDCDSAVADTVDLRANCDTSLDAAAETKTFEYNLICESAITTVTPQ